MTGAATMTSRTVARRAAPALALAPALIGGALTAQSSPGRRRRRERPSALAGHALLGAGNFSGELPISSRICGGGLACTTPKCYVRVYLDGTRIFDGSTRMREIEDVGVGRLRTEAFSGIEYYSSASGLPAEYSGRNAECGTVLFWSRET